MAISRRTIRPVAGPVGQSTGQKLGIGNKNYGIVKCFHHRGTNIDLLDHAGEILSDFNDVPLAEGLAENHQQSADEVVDDVLHAETDTNGQAAGDHGETGQTEPEGAQRVQPEHGPEQVGESGLNGTYQSVVQPDAVRRQLGDERAPTEMTERVT